ncbi:GAF domain-containing protein [Lipingzhangella sp. LS1_29]|uniref:GAF domain-containing protein n=1 Tax=Lipingzhangella rawalii TaxID=2055835 RepID=A0ABU2H2U8_9ACTN|nr:GAF domain-containing protein [Lipingzhangella rawalii]MDS1269617.1 GAF domain-containing protein [Lipingzhangella rawalii]
MAPPARPDEPQTWSALPPLLRDSWQRSSSYVADPARALAPIEFPEDDLADYRRTHPLAVVRPVLDQLLLRPAADAGLIVAIGDAHGRLLWVDGAPAMLRTAENSVFQAGANWSEQAIGTSAPGTALATGRSVQVRQEEHFAAAAHQFSCSATPIRCPHTGAQLGVVDLTGGAEAVATHALPLVNAAVSAAEAELRMWPAARNRPRLTTLGSLAPQLSAGAADEPLALRHAELLALLAWDAARHRGARGAGLSAAQLANDLYGEPGHEVALRAELVRLRKLLRSRPAAGEVDLRSRPYRLSGQLDLDAVLVADALTRGDRSTALDLYGGMLLPSSEAPGIMAIRHELSVLLRETIVQDGSAAELWRYLQLEEARGDEEAVITALRLLPPDAPQRAALVARQRC